MAESLSGPPGNPSSLHRFGRLAAQARELARSRVAKAMGCEPEEVLFTSGGTEADNLALRGALPATAAHVVTVATEHEAVLQTVEALEEHGTAVTVVAIGAD